MIRHKGKSHPGQHEAIIDQGLWDQVDSILAEESAVRASQTLTRRNTDAILRGLLFAPNGDRMLPTATKKPSGKRYRYYLPSSDKKYGRGTNPFGIVSAEQIEGLVLEQVKAALQAPEAVQAVWEEIQRCEAGIPEPAVVLALRNLGGIWEQMFPVERCRLVQLLIERVQLREDGIDIEWRPLGWSTLVGELVPHSIGAELREMEEMA